jgi:hypothetical protein
MRALIGESAVTGTYPQFTPGYATVNMVGSDATTTTILNADGFVYTLYLEGQIGDKPMIYVTYKLTPVTGDTSTDFDADLSSSNVSYDSNEGFRVYHAIYK